LGGHESGQLPYSAMTRPRTTDDAAIRRAMAWIDDHYAEPNPVAAMSERSGLTRRTFARRFVAATGRRPIDYVHAVRMEHARQRIETGRDPIDDVGFQVGYEDPAFFRRLFKRTTGLTPTAYRRRYEPIASGPASTSSMRVLEWAQVG
jgi:transcriptional regulator GlxA family with amidase domain